MKTKIIHPTILLGHPVTSKKTGLPMTGTVVGIQFGNLQDYIFRKTGRSPKRWDDLYPDWRTKFVYSVLFDGEPRPQLTFEEWKLCEMPDEFKTIEYYNDNVPRDVVANYPQDDLEILE